MKFYKNIVYFLFTLLFLVILNACDSNTSPQDKTTSKKIDSVAIYIKGSKEESIDLEKRKALLVSAYKFNQKLDNDSVVNRNLLDIAIQAFIIKDSIFFKKTNKEALQLSTRLKDTYGIGDANWNYGFYYSRHEKMDSSFIHYHKAYTQFKILDKKISIALILKNMAFIQGRITDYTGAEISIFKAISIFKDLKRYNELFDSYNFLMELNIDLEEYDKAFSYYDNVNKYLKLLKDKGVKTESALNSLGLIYQNLNKHKEAVAAFDKALKIDHIRNKNLRIYATLLDNKSYNRLFLNDTTGLLLDFFEGLHIRDSLKIKSAVLMSRLHMAEYYAKYNDTLEAVANLKEAYKLARIVKNGRDALDVLNLLARVDVVNAENHLRRYVKLSDSLLKEERKIRNKFTRIRFETDEYIEETKYLNNQKKWILIIGLFLISTLSLLYYIKRQNSKNKELNFEREQQKANEEIYSLLLKHQAKMEEGRLQERQRISEDLHDGVLSKLFGTRMSFGFLKLKGADTDLKKYETNLKEIQLIEKEIRVISHELQSENLSSNFDFIDILKNLVQKQSKIGSYKYEIKNDEKINWTNIEDKIKINLYRIILEAVQNITKYAKASQVALFFTYKNNTIQLTIKDNGSGFDTSKKSKGIGLKNMRSRIQKLNGKFEMISKTNTGTEISLTIPVKYKGHDKKV